jgi:ATP-dependent helicase HrpB
VTDALPIDAALPAVQAALRATNALLLMAPPGSGKTTRVPPALLPLLAADQQIVVLEPRRLAARAAASRVAQELGCELGGLVGYQVRFDNVTSRDTRLSYVTEGVMLRQLLEDPELRGVGCIVIDEFHERHLDGDLVLAFARALQQGRRPDLKILVMSATLVPGPLADFMQPCRLLESEGRTYPVAISYQPPLKLKTGQPEPLWDQAARACEALVQTPGFDGDILVFMPGAYEIRKTMTALSGRALARSAQCAICSRSSRSRGDRFVRAALAALTASSCASS